MGCRFTIDGKTYEEDGFRSYLKAMSPAEASKYMPGVKSMPEMPFEKTWHELAMKRLLRYGAENGYQRLSWDTGDTNADRYDLSKQVENIKVRSGANAGNIVVDITPNSGGKVSIEVNKEGNVVATPNRSADQFVGKSLADVVGKEMADKIISDRNEGSNLWGVKNRESGNWSPRFATKEEAETYQNNLPASLKSQTDVLEMTPRFGKEYSGLDLKIGGEGMKVFYDKILPAFMNKYGKKWGAKVEDVRIPGDRDHETPYRVAHDGKDYWVEDKTGKQISGKFDSAIKAMDERDAMMVGPKTHSLPITPVMRESVMQGQPLHSPRISEATQDWVRQKNEATRSSERAESAGERRQPVAREPVARRLTMPNPEGKGRTIERALNEQETSALENADQMARAARLVNRNYPRAVEIALRQTQPPEGMLPSFVYFEVERRATKEGDHELIQRLANSPLAEEVTTAGRIIQSFATRDPQSAVAKIQEVQAARLTAATQRHGDLAKASDAVTQKADGDIKKAVAAQIKKRPPPLEELRNFIQSIKCT